ncbi:MAG: nucleotidyltransferase [Anaerolineae bacterium]|nr:nucleotidyltransferase [Anaerolineae bacterium]
MAEQHPELQVRFVVQDEMRGQSHAIYLAKEYLNGPMLMVFADTLIETDLSFLANESADAVAWVKPVIDPRRFGVAEIGKGDWVTRLIEKPKDMNNNLAVVGFYFFKQSEDLLSAIESQFEQDNHLKGEFYLADAVNIMIERGTRMRTERVDVWLDAGTTEAVLETNRYLLTHGHATQLTDPGDNTIIHPVFVHPDASVETSVIGPYTSIGAGCTVKNCIVRDSILEDHASAEDIILDRSLIGQNARVSHNAISMNIGDNSEVQLKR